MDPKQRKKQIEDLERDVDELGRLVPATDETDAEIDRIRTEVTELKREFYKNMGAWQRVLLARHPQRPYTLDWVRLLCSDFSEIHGDREYGDDPAIVCGMAKFQGRPVMVIGNQKGRDTKQRLERNFGHCTRMRSISATTNL